MGGSWGWWRGWVSDSKLSCSYAWLEDLCVFMWVCVLEEGVKVKKKSLFPWRLMTFSGEHQRRAREVEGEVYRRQIGCCISLLCSWGKFKHHYGAVLLFVLCMQANRAFIFFFAQINRQSMKINKISHKVGNSVVWKKEKENISLSK